MTARDIKFGRQGGRFESWVAMEGPTAEVKCLCGYATVPAHYVEAADHCRRCRTCHGRCSVCGEPRRELDSIDWRIRNHERVRAGLPALPLPDGMVAAGEVETAEGLAEARDVLRRAS